jgi:hypothetical protein
MAVQTESAQSLLNQLLHSVSGTAVESQVFCDVLVGTDVLLCHVALIFRVKQSKKRVDCLTLKMKVLPSFETSRTTCITTQILHPWRSES